MNYIQKLKEQKIKKNGKIDDKKRKLYEKRKFDR